MKVKRIYQTKGVTYRELRNIETETGVLLDTYLICEILGGNISDLILVEYKGQDYWIYKQPTGRVILDNITTLHINEISEIAYILGMKFDDIKIGVLYNEDGSWLFLIET